MPSYNGPLVIDIKPKPKFIFRAVAIFLTNQLYGAEPLNQEIPRIL